MTKIFSSRILFFLLIFSITALFAITTGSVLTPLRIRLQLVTKGLTSPVGMASPQDGTNRIFVIQQNGKIKIIKNGVLLTEPFLTISDRMDALNIAYSEKGLLGLVFHPDYKSNGRFFIYYSAPPKDKNSDHTGIVAEYHVSASSPDIADPKESIILEIPEPESNHNGGCLEFGKDGYLYIALGDGGGAGDRHGSSGNAQNLNSLLGKILRIDVKKKPYLIPPDNPFLQRNDARPEIYAYGLRNPWRFSFDRATGILYCGDVGQDKWEEINIIEKGKNYGWRIMEGNHCYQPDIDCKTNGLSLPIAEYSHETGISICGGYMYRGSMFPSLHGNYFFADWTGKLFFLREDKDHRWLRGDVLSNDNRTNDIGASINSMGVDDRGEIYVITQHLSGPKSPTGAVYRIEL